MCLLIRNDQGLDNDFLEFPNSVHNFIGLSRVILDVNKHCLYYNTCWLIRNDQDISNVFLEFSNYVRNFTGLSRVFLVLEKQYL